MTPERSGREDTDRSHDSDPIRTAILDLAATNRDLTVQGAYRALKKENSDLSEELFLREVLRLKSAGVLTLREGDLSGSFVRFLIRWDSNMWLYVVVSLTIFALIGVYTIPDQYPYEIIRWFFGSFFILFIPGFATTHVLYDKGLTVLVSGLLSVGLSIVLILVFGFLLNFLPWGINILSVTTSMSGYTLLIALAGSWRKYRSLR